MDKWQKWSQCGTDILQETGYLLASFPEGYRLFEHIKKSEKDGKSQVNAKSKTHAAGGNDRQDAYLYGHPSGRKKRYRSPADFFPHLLWLCTDESGDPDNCTCKICSPEDMESLFASTKPSKNDKSVKQEVEARPHNMLTPQTNFPLGSQNSTQDVKPKQNVMAIQRQGHPPRQLKPTPLPARTSLDQQVDSQYRGLKYRPGELVWFRRGQAWGLGVVLRRWILRSKQHHYTIQPLSHPFQQQSSVTKSSDDDMRPWLAWSVPRFTFPGLNDLPEPARYETVNWQGMSQQRYGSGGELEVDGSILAAKSIDCSYTPFGHNKTVEPEMGVTELHYDGIFLGAEKIWVGEPVRLANAGTDIMVVHSIVERKRSAVMTQQTLEPSTFFIGDTYSLSSVPHANPNVPTPASPNNNPDLPQRLTEDLAYRNARSIQVRRVASYWKLTSSMAQIDLTGVKGRWYEATIWLPILQPDSFKAMDIKGDVQELSLFLNARGDCLQANRDPALPKAARPNVRRNTRREALGPAVPGDARITDGIEPPLSDNLDPLLKGAPNAGESMDLDPRFDAADDSGRADTAATGMDQFVHLDGIDTADSMPGYGSTFQSQGGGGQGGGGQGGYY